MSAGSALLETPLSHFEFAVAGTGSHHRYRGRMESSSATTSSSSAFSDEDLIASLAGFAVEGQTERDLATIKSMLLSQQQQHHQPSQQQQFTHNSYSSSNGGMWPMQSPAGNFPPSLSAWSAANAAAWNPASGQPPPNTPTLSKSLELYGSSGGNYNNDYFPYGSGSRRRDVSLERPHLLHSSTSRSSSRHARSASITSSTANGGAGGEEMSTPGSSLSTAFDMDMEEDIAPPPTAGPSQYQRFHMQQQQAGDGAAIAMNAGMEDIQEDSMRESMEDESCTSSSSQHPNHPHSSSSFSPSSASAIKGSNGKSIFDNRNAGVAESPHNYRGDANQQWRSSNTSTPTFLNNNASSNGHNGTTSSSTSRPHSRNGSATPTSPPQTRSRSRQQQAQAQAQAGLRFTSHS